MPHSITSVETVLAKSQTHGAARFLLTVIATHMNAGGLAWPSVKTLAKETHFGERYVHRLLKTLHASHELDIDEGKGPFGANLYRLGGLLTTPHTADIEEGVVYGSDGVVYGSDERPQRVVPEPPEGTSKMKVNKGTTVSLAHEEDERRKEVATIVASFVGSHRIPPPVTDLEARKAYLRRQAEQLAAEERERQSRQ
jgi:hypothetical protein